MRAFTSSTEFIPQNSMDTVSHMETMDAVSHMETNQGHYEQNRAKSCHSVEKEMPAALLQFQSIHQLPTVCLTVVLPTSRLPTPP